jgi:hypothetical protein
VTCPGCGLGFPADWCWEGRFDCPCGKPPRRPDEASVWAIVVDLQRRVEALEDPLRAGASAGGNLGWDGVITLARRDTAADPVTAEEMEAGLRDRYGWTDDMLNNDMRELLGNIATSLNELDR